MLKLSFHYLFGLFWALSLFGCAREAQEPSRGGASPLGAGPEVSATLVAGQTTVAQALSALGAPDERSSEGDREYLAYFTEKRAQAYVLTLVGPGGQSLTARFSPEKGDVVRLVFVKGLLILERSALLAR